MACEYLGPTEFLAGDIVTEGYKSYQEFASEAVEASGGAIEALEDMYLSMPSTNVGYKPPLLDNTGNFAQLIKPTFAGISFNTPTLGYNPSIDPNPGVSFDDPPTFDAVLPTYNKPSKPDALTVSDPGDAPTLTDVTLPDAPVVVLPNAPSLNGITIPELSEITLPTWDVEAPDGDLIAPDGTFSWSEPGYESATLDAVRERIQTMLAGGTGLPEPIWDMIWDKARAQLSAQREAAIIEATERWAAKGWSCPGGALNKQVERAIAQFNDLSAERFRELTIKRAEMEVQNMQFAVAQGIALETMLISLYQGMAQRSLEAAKTVFDVLNNLFAAKVQKYNADAMMYQARAAVFKTRIEAAVAVLEQDKLKLEGQKLIGEINVQQVQLYAAQVDALVKTIDIFKAELDGVRAQVEVDKGRVEAYSATVGAYRERIQAKAIEYQAYETQIKAELANVDIYKAQTEAFAARVNAYNYETQAKGAQVDAHTKIQSLQIEKFKGYVAKLEAEVRMEAARVDALARQYDSQVKMYDTDAQVEKLRITTAIEQNRIAIENAKVNAEVAIKEADLRVQALQRNQALEAERLKAAANMRSQLAAGAMAAVNLSATITGQQSFSAQSSSSCSYEG